MKKNTYVEGNPSLMPRVTYCLENIIGVLDQSQTIIIDLDGIIQLFKINGDEQSEIQQAILSAFYKKMDIKNKHAFHLIDK